MVRLVFVLLLAACGSKQSPDDAITAEPTVLPSGSRGEPSTVVAPPEPVGTARIAGLLRARHTADLPDRTTLDANLDEDALAVLSWLAQYGDPLATRARAISLLSLYDEAEAVAVQRAIAASPSAHSSLVAAALTGLGERDLTVDTASRDVVQARTADPDPRIAGAAVKALAE